MTITTKTNLNALIKALVDGFESELKALPMKKQVRECLTDGFKQGVRSGVHHAVKMLEVEVKDE